MAQNNNREQLARINDLAAKIVTDGVNENNCIEIVEELKVINEKKPRELYNEKEYGFFMLSLMGIDKQLTLIQFLIKSLYYDYMTNYMFSKDVVSSTTTEKIDTKSCCEKEPENKLLKGETVDDILDARGEIKLERSEGYPEIIDKVKTGRDGKPLGIYLDRSNKEPGLNYIVNWDPETYDPDFFDPSLKFSEDEWFVLNEKESDPDDENLRVMITFRFNRYTYQRINMKRDVIKKPNLDLSVENIFSGFLADEDDKECVKEDAI